MNITDTPYSLDASRTSCWKCNGSGRKKLRVAPTGDISSQRGKKKVLADVSCSLCSGLGFTVAAPLTNSPTARVLRKGFVRPFNPPVGWICPGPKAAMDILTAGETLLGDGEMITSLAGSWSIFQLVQGHRYTTDDLSTAAIAILAAKSPLKSHVDIGCGLGSVLLFVKWKFHSTLERSVGIEAQEKHVELARKSIFVNMGDNHDNTVVSQVRHGDLRSLAQGSNDFLLKNEENSFDLVTGTPPYFPVSHGVVPTVQGRGMCSFELRGGVETYCLAAKRLLSRTNEARFVFVQTAIEISRSETAIWELAEMDILERVDFRGAESKEPLFVIFICGWGEKKEDYPIRSIAVRTNDGKYSHEYHDLLVLVGKPPLQNQ